MRSHKEVTTGGLSQVASCAARPASAERGDCGEFHAPAGTSSIGGVWRVVVSVRLGHIARQPIGDPAHMRSHRTGIPCVVSCDDRAKARSVSGEYSRGKARNRVSQKRGPRFGLTIPFDPLWFRIARRSHQEVAGSSLASSTSSGHLLDAGNRRRIDLLVISRRVGDQLRDLKRRPRDGRCGRHRVSTRSSTLAPVAVSRNALS